MLKVSKLVWDRVGGLYPWKTMEGVTLLAEKAGKQPMNIQCGNTKMKSTQDTQCLAHLGVHPRRQHSWCDPFWKKITGICHFPPLSLSINTGLPIGNSQHQPWLPNLHTPSLPHPPPTLSLKCRTYSCLPWSQSSWTPPLQD